MSAWCRKARKPTRHPESDRILGLVSRTKCLYVAPRQRKWASAALTASPRLQGGESLKHEPGYFDYEAPARARRALERRERKTLRQAAEMHRLIVSRRNGEDRLVNVEREIGGEHSG